MSNLTHIVQGEQESPDAEPSKEVELEVEVNIRFIFTNEHWLGLPQKPGKYFLCCIFIIIIIIYSFKINNMHFTYVW